MSKNAMPMAWNEPGGRDKDPWGKDQGPPDLDQVFRRFHERLRGAFGGSGGQSDDAPGFNIGGMWLITIAVVIWALSGIYIVKPAEQAVVTRFGAYHATKGPGPHWLPTFVDRKQVVDVERVHESTHKGQMITQDENLVEVEIAVQYRIDDAKEFLFNVTNPINALRHSSESALRQVVGNSTLDQVITLGRSEIQDNIHKQVEAIVDKYKAGITVLKVEMQPARAPEEVKAAFDDAIKAREELVSRKNKAESYANTILPRAEGEARKLLQQAEGYRESVVLKAKGETQKFDLILPQVKNKSTRKITYDRLYLEAMQSVLENSSTVLIDLDSKSGGNGSNNLVYLPIDRLLASNPGQRSMVDDPEISATQEDTINSVTNTANQALSDVRDRYRRRRG